MGEFHADHVELRIFMADNKLSTYDVAELVGVSERTVRRWRQPPEQRKTNTAITDTQFEVLVKQVERYNANPEKWVKLGEEAVKTYGSFYRGRGEVEK
jgi:predicted transcriptional regulator